MTVGLAGGGGGAGERVEVQTSLHCEDCLKLSVSTSMSDRHINRYAGDVVLFKGSHWCSHPPQQNIIASSTSEDHALAAVDTLETPHWTSGWVELPMIVCWWSYNE